MHISYYTQHADGTVDVDMATSDNGGATFPVNKKKRVTSQSFNLPPTNIPLPTATNPFAATNYDQLIAVCYALGEYQSLTGGEDSLLAAWGDARNQLTEPVNALSPIPGQTHPEQDVFVQILGQDGEEQGDSKRE